MTENQLQKLFEKHKCRELAFKGKCHDCGGNVEVVCHVEDDGKLTVIGGAVYWPEGEPKPLVKCDECFRGNEYLSNYHQVETYNHIINYLRPVQQWNPGKQAEFNIRKDFNNPM